MTSRPLWTCPHCARTFANLNQTHTWAPLGSLYAHFTGKDPAVRATFDRILEVIATLGPVTILPEKTRIALHVRMSFAAFTPRNVLHAFRLLSPDEVDSELSSLLTEAYEVGQQYHLRPR